jgi:hypothetical protein
MAKPSDASISDVLRAVKSLETRMDTRFDRLERKVDDIARRLLHPDEQHEVGVGPEPASRRR